MTAPRGCPPRPTVHHGDGLAALEVLAAGSVAAVVTDPPWNIGKPYGDGVDDARPHADYATWLRRVVTAALRAARDAVVLLPGSPNVGTLAAVLAHVGAPWRRTLWWEPPPASIRPPRTLDVRSEPVVWLRHAPPRGPAPNAPIRVPLDEDPYLGPHPCPKPVALLRALISCCIEDDGPIVDPFAGACSTLVAARQLGLPATGYEANAAFHRLAAARVDPRMPECA